MTVTEELNPGDWRLAQAKRIVGDLLRRLGRHSEAMAEFGEALVVAETCDPYRPSIESTVLTSISVLLTAQGKHKDSLSVKLRGLQLDRQCLPDDHPNIAISFFNIGASYFNLRCYSAALPYYQKALDISEASRGLDHPHTKQFQSLVSRCRSRSPDFPAVLPDPLADDFSHPTVEGEAVEPATCASVAAMVAAFSL